MIPAIEAARAISAQRGGAVAVAATSALRAWASVSQRRELDVDLSDCMDKAPSLALGLALARPHHRVLVLDCDTVLRTNISALVTIGHAAPTNLVHFLFEDSSHLATGGQAIGGLERINFRALAEGAGYRRAYAFDNLEEFVLSLGEVLEGPGPTFVSLQVVHDQEPPPYPDRSLERSMATVREELSKGSR